jgi:hypothetical protein
LAGLEYEPSAEIASKNQVNDWQKYCANVECEELQIRWDKEKNPPKSFTTPKSFIDWAVSRDIKPHWLDWAINRRLYFPTTNTNLSFQVFDVNSSTYPPELDIAFKVWWATSSAKGKGKGKAKIRKWLEENTDISEAAIKRLEIVVNWDKRSGPAKTD